MFIRGYDSCGSGTCDIIGDAKYGDLNINAKIKRKYDLTTQLLHAYKIVLNGKEIEDQLPQRFEAIVKDNFNV